MENNKFTTITVIIIIICLILIHISMICIIKLIYDTRDNVKGISYNIQKQSQLQSNNLNYLRQNLDTLTQKSVQKSDGMGNFLGNLNPIAMAKELSPAAQAAKVASQALDKSANLIEKSQKKENQSEKESADKDENDQ